MALNHPSGLSCCPPLTGCRPLCYQAETKALDGNFTAPIMRLLTSAVAGQKPGGSGSEKSFKEGVDTVV